MTDKEKAPEVAKNMPDDASIEDAMERLLFLAKVEKGLQQADSGQFIPHEDVKERIEKWVRWTPQAAENLETISYR